MTVAHSFLADLSAEVYGRAEKVRDWLDERGWRLIEFIDRKDTQAAVALNDQEEGVIAFRGTEPTRVHDWATDLKAHKVSYDVGKVHAGFLAAAQTAFKASRLDLHGICYIVGMHPNVTWHGTGHSLGAALIRVTSLFIRNEFPRRKLRPPVTFGEPRSLDDRLAVRYDAVIPGSIRYVNNCDPVCRVPLPKWKLASRFVPFWWLMPAGFRHVGTLRYVTAGIENDDADVIDDPPLADLMLDRLKGHWLGGRHWIREDFKDHEMWRYQDAARVWEQEQSIKQAA